MYGYPQSRPVWISHPRVRVRMGRDIARATWVPRLEPRATNVFVLFVDLILHIPQRLDLVCKGDARDSSPNDDDSDAAGLVDGLVFDHGCSDGPHDGERFVERIVK